MIKKHSFGKSRSDNLTRVCEGVIYRMLEIFEWEFCVKYFGFVVEIIYVLLWGGYLARQQILIKN